MLKECTPGPWTVDPMQVGQHPRVESADRHVADCGNAEAWAQHADRWLADARLIAAAPEMALVNWARDRGVWFFDWNGADWSVQEWGENEDGSEMVNEWRCPDNGFNCPALPPDLFARLRAEMEAGGC